MISCFNFLQNKIYWPETEKWLQQRYAEMNPGYEHGGDFRILGYQWRVLRFNDNTNQSTVKIMAAYRKTEPGSIFIMQQAQCLATPCKLLLYFFSQICHLCYVSSKNLVGE